MIRLGDPHLGKVFKTGVPLHRRGERETGVLLQFQESLMDCTTGIHLCMGDLFDTREVPYEVVLFAARAYKLAAEQNPNAVYIVERGNHDASRTVGQASAYDVFAEALRGVPNIFVLEDEAFSVEGHLVIPWHPFKSAAEMVPSSGHFKSVNGHWDVRDFGGDNHNLAPAKRLAGITADIFTGHEHKPQLVTIEGVPINVCGSMQPYAFGEEATPVDYLSLSLSEATGYAGSLHDKTVRLLLRPGEVAPVDLDCRQMVIQRIGEDDDIESIAVTVSDFDMEKLWTESAEHHGLTEDTNKKVWSLLNAS